MEFRTPLAGLISIHAPRMGSDKSLRRNSDSFYAFQSTLPGWGATNMPLMVKRYSSDFNPRSPDGERHARCPDVPRIR